MPIKQSVYRLADEPRATILVRTSSATNAGTDKDSDKRQRTAITGVIGRRAVPLLLSQGHSVTIIIVTSIAVFVPSQSCRGHLRPHLDRLLVLTGADPGRNLTSAWAA